MILFRECRKTSETELQVRPRRSRFPGDRRRQNKSPARQRWSIPDDWITILLLLLLSFFIGINRENVGNRETDERQDSVGGAKAVHKAVFLDQNADHDCDERDHKSGDDTGKQ